MNISKMTHRFRLADPMTFTIDQNVPRRENPKSSVVKITTVGCCVTARRIFCQLQETVLKQKTSPLSESIICIHTSRFPIELQKLVIVCMHGCD